MTIPNGLFKVQLQTRRKFSTDSAHSSSTVFSRGQLRVNIFKYFCEKKSSLFHSFPQRPRFCLSLIAIRVSYYWQIKSLLIAPSIILIFTTTISSSSSSSHKFAPKWNRRNVCSASRHNPRCHLFRISLTGAVSDDDLLFQWQSPHLSSLHLQLPTFISSERDKLGKDDEPCEDQRPKTKREVPCSSATKLPQNWSLGGD